MALREVRVESSSDSIFGPPGSRRRRIAFFSIVGLVLAFVLWFFREVLTPFALALVVAYVLAPVVDAACRIRIGKRAVPRWIAVLVIYIALLGMLAGIVSFAVPRLAAEVQRVGRELPGHV